MGDAHTGGCFCGTVRYETQGEPVRVSVCSCEWCRKRTGSALGLSVYFDDTNITFNNAKRTRFQLTSDAGRWLQTEFCPNCGTTVSWTLEFQPGKRGIAGGTFDPPLFWFTPERYAFARSKPDWLHISGDLAVYQAMPD
jgi:hypothetical protein